MPCLYTLWLFSCVFVIGSVAVIVSNNATTVCLRNDPDTGVEFSPCQQRARLTSSFANSCGAIWAPSLLDVNDSFTVRFSLQISNVTGYCAEHHDVYRSCKNRGGHGLALVIQNDNSVNGLSTFIGQCGQGLGYAGIRNSLALELDLWYDPELFDLYDNHIALQSMSTFPNSNDHRNSLAASADIKDLADGQMHTIQLYYQPTIDMNVLSPEKCIETSVFASMLTTTYSASSSMGLLSVYMDDLVEPVFITPINMNDLLSLNQGKAYIGIAASTGHYQFQSHDVFNWTFCSSSCQQLL